MTVYAATRYALQAQKTQIQKHIEAIYLTEFCFFGATCSVSVFDVFASRFDMLRMCCVFSSFHCVMSICMSFL